MGERESEVQDVAGAVAWPGDDPRDVLLVGDLRDWVAEVFAPRLTREGLIGLLQKLGFKATERQLRSWVSYGVIPPPTRRLPPRATDGKARALYPVWMFFVLMDLLDAARSGATIAELKEAAPGRIRVAKERLLSDNLLLQVDAEGQVIRTYTPPVPRALQRDIRAYADRYGEQSGTDIQRVELVLRCEDGQAVTIPIHPTPATPSTGWFSDSFLRPDTQHED